MRDIPTKASSEQINVDDINHPYFNSDDSKHRIKDKGHRGYIGGNSLEMWYGIGMLQYHFLVYQGLKHDHHFLDIACGALRLGQFIIPYLDRGNYFGLDAEKELVSLALQHELPSFLIKQKNPNFSFNYNFDFSFIDSFDFAMAQSLFTHLTLEDIAICFHKLKLKAHKDSKFFFTFFEGNSSTNSHTVSHANKCWHYNFQELEIIAKKEGWELTYIGDWNHPRNQKIVLAQLV